MASQLVAVVGYGADKGTGEEGERQHPDQRRVMMSYKKLPQGGVGEDPEEEEDLLGAVGGDLPPILVPEGDISRGKDLAALYHLVQKSLQNQDREAFMQEQRWRSIQIQLNQFRDELEVERLGGREEQQEHARSPRWMSQPPRPSRVGRGAGPETWMKPAVPKLEQGDDIEQYLTTFERLATAYQWARGDWAVCLVPYLTGKARGAYVAMDMEEAMDYDWVKEAILMKYEINEEVYRQISGFRYQDR